MNSISKIGLKGVVIGVAIQVVAMPVMAEEIHGQLTNTWQGNPEDFYLLMGVGINPAG